MNRALTGYDVGALMYCPANMHGRIVEALRDEQFGKPFSLAFCLEDTVSEDAVEAAEEYLYNTLMRIDEAAKNYDFYLPLIFVRIRSAQQLEKLAVIYSCFSNILTGFIIPKFFLDNCDEYIEKIQNIKKAGFQYYYMPIFESSSMIDLEFRHQKMAAVKQKLDQVKDRILNIRVGGNDLSHAFSLRRPVDSTIYDLRPVADILIDIITTFGTTYVVSGAVWEYYSGNGWDDGLRKELRLDQLNGFIGKTVIHPKQIAIVNESLRVNKSDFDDACKILNWDNTDGSLVSASSESTRMNEYKTHYNWASKICRLASVYGYRGSNQVESYKEEKIIANQEIDISACMLYYKTQGR